jgi:tRNA (adenine22-N1)-methyltransferase
MGNMKLSKRLQAVANQVLQGARVADIGSDHAKLPIWLVENAVSDFVVAGEVAKGPFEIAQEACQEISGIEVRLGDGLSVLQAEDGVDTVVIAGMGGVLISEILERGPLDGLKRLILQANNEEAELRKWLMEHDWMIAQEEILEDKGKIYELMVYQRGEEVLSDKELTFGKNLAGPVFEKKWQKGLVEIEKIQSLHFQTELEAEKKKIEEVLSERR